MTATVLSLTPATSTIKENSTKVTLAEVAAVRPSTVVTVALRDNGHNVNGTLVFIVGADLPVGDVVNAKRATSVPLVYGPHLVLGTVRVDMVAENEAVVPAVTVLESDIELDLDTKAAFFDVGSLESAPTVDVVRVKDNAVVAAAVSVEEAEDMIARAKANKKAKLAIVL